MSLIDTQLRSPRSNTGELQPVTGNGGYACLVLNADYQPLSYFPLSLWSWQDAIKAVFLDRVNVVENYGQIVRSSSLEMHLPSVVALKDYVPQNRAPAFTRFNLFLRDGFSCVYCGSGEDLTFDHVVPRRLGGKTSWDNIVAACTKCNFKKGGRSLRGAGLSMARQPAQPTVYRAAISGPEISARSFACKLARFFILGCGA